MRKVYWKDVLNMKKGSKSVGLPKKPDKSPSADGKVGHGLNETEVIRGKA
jgi:hypothetical protein